MASGMWGHTCVRSILSSSFRMVDAIFTWLGWCAHSILTPIVFLSHSPTFTGSFLLPQLSDSRSHPDCLPLRNCSYLLRLPRAIDSLSVCRSPRWRKIGRLKFLQNFYYVFHLLHVPLEFWALFRSANIFYILEREVLSSIPSYHH